MNEEATPEAQAAPDSTEPPESSPPPATVAGGGLPGWLPYAALAIVPAVIVGILVFVFAGGDGGGGNGHAPGILETLLVPEQDSNTRVESYEGELPAEFPAEVPIFAAADTVASFTVVTPEGTTYTAIFTTDESAGEVFGYYQDVLDSDPWQIEVGQAGVQITGLRFTRTDNADVSGVIIVSESELEDVTVIRLFYEDVAASLTPGTGPATPPQLGISQPLPPGFPEETVPVYGADASTIIDTGFQRAPGGQLFFLTLLTQDSEDDVIAFYREAFEGMNWEVTEATPTDITSLAIGIEFADEEDSTTGIVTADLYEDDPAFTRVDIQVQVSGARTGN